MIRPARFAPGIAALLLLTLFASSRVALAASQSSCVNGGSQNQDIAALKTALQRYPNQLGKRLELANLLEKAGCFAEAVHFLEEGKKYNPYNPTLAFSLRRAHSKLEEERYREGDALAKAHRPAEATKAYIRASELEPNDTALAGKLQALKSQRQALMKRCTDGDGDAALQACKSVLVKGAPNEFEITVRIALLQQGTNQASRALDSYIAANSLRHGDKGVALAILALLQSTSRKDAIALAARGSSLVTLGRAHEALAPLRQAKALEPELPDIDHQLKAAEAQARTESAAHKKRPAEVAALSAAAEVMPEPPSFSNVAEATRSN